MAAIGLKVLLAYRRAMLSCAALLICSGFVSPLRADRAADVLAIVNHVATGLTDSSPTDALEPFSKNWADYVRLRDSFIGLTSRGDLINEVDVLDEEDTERETKLTVQWTLTIMSRENSSSVESRTQPMKIRITPQGKRWKIVELSPISFFDPQPTAKSR